jgi:hypothetical protein
LDIPRDPYNRPIFGQDINYGYTAPPHFNFGAMGPYNSQNYQFAPPHSYAAMGPHGQHWQMPQIPYYEENKYHFQDPSSSPYLIGSSQMVTRNSRGKVTLDPIPPPERKPRTRKANRIPIVEPNTPMASPMRLETSMVFSTPKDGQQDNNPQISDGTPKPHTSDNDKGNPNSYKAAAGGSPNPPDDASGDDSDSSHETDDHNDHDDNDADDRDNDDDDDDDDDEHDHDDDDDEHDDDVDDHDDTEEIFFTKPKKSSRSNLIKKLSNQVKNNQSCK